MTFLNGAELAAKIRMQEGGKRTGEAYSYFLRILKQYIEESELMELELIKVERKDIYALPSKSSAGNTAWR